MAGQKAKTDVAVIGAGPTGLFAVFECGMLKASCHVIDVLDMPGGQLSALYPEKPIYDIPGFPEIRADELVQRLTDQASPFNPVYHFGQRVETLDETPEGSWRLVTSAGTEITAKAVVIAGGVGAFGPNRPPIEGIEDFEGESVHYMVARRDDFAGKNVVIAGGGDSAVDWVNSLAEVAKKVTVLHRRKKFRAAPKSVEIMEGLVADGVVDLMIPFQPVDLEGRGGRIDAVIAVDLDGNRQRVEADAFLPFYGLSMNLGPIAQWGLNLDQNRIAVSPETMATSTHGIFAIGDIATYEGKLKLILQGFSEAAVAAHAIYPLVHPGEALHFNYSTTTGVPGAEKTA